MCPPQFRSAKQVARPLRLLTAVGLVGIWAAACRSPSDNFPVAPTPTAATCIGTCAPDSPPSPVDCKAEEAGLEFISPPVWDFETGVGRNMYVYTDNSTPNIFSYANDTQPSYEKRVGYEPTAAVAKRCSNQDSASRNVMHIAGGPFRGFGGGMGISFSNFYKSKTLCPGLGGELPDYCPDLPFSDIRYGRILDLSEWDGISLWARRGPNGQAAIRVGLGDTNTDDDISYVSYTADPNKPRACERNLECHCPDRKPCSIYFEPSRANEIDYNGTLFCWDPMKDPLPINDEESKKIWTDQHMLVLPTRKCGQTRCNEKYAAEQQDDAGFKGKACTPHSLPSGGASKYCFDPGTDHVPYDGNQTCGDHWIYPVNLTTEWRLYLVPFKQLAQQGFGKKFPKPLIAEASMLRLMWDVGWIDYWIDDVRFYRVKRD